MMSSHCFRETLLMLVRGSFGVATLRARREAHASKPESNTWAAYQCYGDPDYRLSPVASDLIESSGAAKTPHATPEYAGALEYYLDDQPMMASPGNPVCQQSSAHPQISIPCAGMTRDLIRPASLATPGSLPGTALFQREKARATLIRRFAPPGLRPDSSSPKGRRVRALKSGPR